MTESFTISKEFNPHDNKAISTAVKQSILPEDVQILSNKDVLENDEVDGPFVVIASDTNARVSSKAFKMGALGYVPITYDIDILRQKLNAAV